MSNRLFDGEFSRRDLMRASALSSVGFSMSGWLRALADETASDRNRRRSCVLLWMPGGPTQTDTFDMKPGHRNGGQFKPISTAVPGIQISEHLPKLAKRMRDLAIIRSMSTREGDHSRASHLLRTGHLPQGPIRYPSLGALISNELGTNEAELPNFVSIAPYRALSPGAFGPGFLGPRHAPLMVGERTRHRAGDAADSLKVANIDLPKGVETTQADGRLSLLKGIDDRFAEHHPGAVVASHQTAYRKAVTMMRSEARKAFSIHEESSETRDRYGNTRFGQGCLLARRLIERGVPFVEVALSNGGRNWDTHNRIFDSVKTLSADLDAGWSTLMNDLEDRSLLESTTIVWMGEFGRTPKINRQAGRDHYPAAWSTVLGGGGIKGGQVYGSTSTDGTKVLNDPVNVGDLIATVVQALGIDPQTQNMSNVGRPIRIAPADATPIQQLLS